MLVQTLLVTCCTLANNGVRCARLTLWGIQCERLDRSQAASTVLALQTNDFESDVRPIAAETCFLIEVNG